MSTEGTCMQMTMLSPSTIKPLPLPPLSPFFSQQSDCTLYKAFKGQQQRRKLLPNYIREVVTTGMGNKSEVRWVNAAWKLSSQQSEMVTGEGLQRYVPKLGLKKALQTQSRLAQQKAEANGRQEPHNPKLPVLHRPLPHQPETQQK